MRLWHNLTCRHATAFKEDIGEFRFCVARFSYEPRAVYFKPIGGDRWHKVPEPGEGVSDVYRHMLFAASSQEAMSMLRAAKAEAGRYA